MWPDFYAFATTQVPGRPPLPANGAYHVLIETMGTDAEKFVLAPAGVCPNAFEAAA
jgi:hypothetical protein